MTNTTTQQFDKFYVVDTNIILQDATSIITLSDDSQNLIIIPETVLDEIDTKKSGFGEINYQARVFGRLLSGAEVIKMDSVSGDYKIIELKINDKHNVRVDIISKEMYKAESSRTIAPNIMNDRKIIEIAKFAQDHYLVDGTDAKLAFVSLDIMARTRALSLQIPTETLRGTGEEFDYEFHKTVELDGDLEPEEMCGRHVIDLDPDYKCHNFSYSFKLPNGREILTAIYKGVMECLDEDEIRRQAVSPKNKEQLFFSNAIMNRKYQVVVSEARGRVRY